MRSCCKSDEVAIEDRAAAWLVERDEGLSTEQGAALVGWCEADFRHQAALRRLQGAAALLARLAELGPAAGGRQPASANDAAGPRSGPVPGALRADPAGRPSPCGTGVPPLAPVMKFSRGIPHHAA